MSLVDEQKLYADLLTRRFALGGRYPAAEIDCLGAVKEVLRRQRGRELPLGALPPDGYDDSSAAFFAWSEPALNQHWLELGGDSRFATEVGDVLFELRGGTLRPHVHVLVHKDPKVALTCERRRGVVTTPLVRLRNEVVVYRLKADA